MKMKFVWNGLLFLIPYCLLTITHLLFMCSQTGVSNKQIKIFKNLAGVDIKLINL